MKNNVPKNNVENSAYSPPFSYGQAIRWNKFWLLTSKLGNFVPTTLIKLLTTEIRHFGFPGYASADF